MMMLLNLYHHILHLKKINKRAELQYSRDMFNRQDGFLRVVRVIHDDFENWKNTINFYSKNFI